MTRYDERDTMFARMEYVRGSKEYSDYYDRHPELKEEDDLIREMPQLLGEGTATYNPLMGPVAEAGFNFLNDIKFLVHNKPKSEKIIVEPEEITRKIKNIASFMGAKLVGVCQMEPKHYYSHRGRKGVYGEEVTK